MNLEQVLQDCIQIAIASGELTLPYFHNQKQFFVTEKNNQTPVTSADIAAHNFITNTLKSNYSWPIVSEEDAESMPFPARAMSDYLWLIDPLDGTRGFIQGMSEYTVNIALIANHRPILGVIYLPVLERGYAALHGRGAWSFSARDPSALQVLAPSLPTEHSLRLLLGMYCDPDMVQRVLSDLDYAVTQVNSSYKFCTLAKGDADLYPRFGPTSEWDTAAGDVILQEMGGAVVDFKGHPLQYNAKPSLLNPSFLAIADKQQLNHFINRFRGEQL